MSIYTHLFFDLDHTLWDTDRNAEESLKELFVELDLEHAGIPDFNSFHTCYRTHNERLWGLYAENKVGRDAVRVHRFLHTLSDFGIEDGNLAGRLADEFVSRTPYRKHLIPGAVSLLESLSGRFSLSIITNGFKEAQYVKLKSSGIDHFFDHVFISEEVGVHKPDPRIFQHAMQKAGVSNPGTCLMIGDTYLTDVCGALNAGITGVHFDPKGSQIHAAPVITIRKLEHLAEFL
jgi:putative hydrolase of the HAD superfamily